MKRLSVSRDCVFVRLSGLLGEREQFKLFPDLSEKTLVALRMLLGHQVFPLPTAGGYGAAKTTRSRPVKLHVLRLTPCRSTVFFIFLILNDLVLFHAS